MRGLSVGDVKIGIDFSTNATTIHMIDYETGKYSEQPVYHESYFDVAVEKEKSVRIKKEKEPEKVI